MPYQPKVVRNKKKLFGLKDVLSFGKYKNYSIIEILEIEPSYIDWCIYKELFDVTAEVADELEASMQDDLLDSYYPY